MSYNYEKNSKCIYTSNQNDSQTFIFELLLKDHSNNIHVIRRIKKSNSGNLISPDDNIKYNNIKKYKLSVFDINKPNDSIKIKENINHRMLSTTFINEKIYIEINQLNNELMNFNYHLTQ